MEEKHINREYTHSYIIGTKNVHFSPACLRYGADLEKLDQFNRAGAWISGLHDTYTDVYRGYQLPWREIPLIAQTDFGARVEEAFAILESMGIAFGEPEAVAYWDVFAMQSEYDRLQFDQDVSERHALKGGQHGNQRRQPQRLPDIHPRAHDAAADHGDRRGRLPV